MLEKALIPGVVQPCEGTVYRVAGAKTSRRFGALAAAQNAKQIAELLLERRAVAA
jgi:hypothetical protein